MAVRRIIAITGAALGLVFSGGLAAQAAPLSGWHYSQSFLVHEDCVRQGNQDIGGRVQKFDCRWNDTTWWDLYEFTSP
jgi:hypothetical protein